MAKKKNITIKQGLDGWVMTYGDMMSLLLTFFVLIVSFSSMQETKFEQAARSLKDAFGVLAQPESIIKFNEPIVPNHAPEAADLEFLYEVRSVEKAILDQELSEQVEVHLLDDGVLFELPVPLLFPSGAADLKVEANPLLERLARMFRKFPGQVEVQGHTDNVPIHSTRFPSNWELSAARAVAVARNFHGLGLPPERLSATGYGEFRPVADNGTAEGRAENRRVEIKLTWRSEAPPRQESLPLEPVPAAEPAVDPAADTAPEPAIEDTQPAIVSPVTGHLGAAVDIDRN
ncbi:MAG: OmpA family protein [bacterium]|nr:OmpA family protein [bacterium]